MKERSGIEDLKEDLYKRDRKEKYAPVRSSFFIRESAVPASWGGEKTGEKTSSGSVSSLTMFQKLFFASLAFFVLAVIGSLFLFFSGGNIVSSENVDIKVLGPIAVPGGEELSLQIAITNNNKTPLEYTDLVVEYPEGTRSADGGSALPRFRKSIGEVKSGETVNEIVRASLYGKEGTTFSIPISIEYRVGGSNAIFVKEVAYQVSLSSAPLSIFVDTLTEVNANQEITLHVTISSNAEAPVEDVLLRVEYPFGFEPSSAEPKPRYGMTIWELGTIESGKSVSVSLSGILRGQDNEEKTFAFLAGRRDERNERDIAAIYSLASAEILVKRAFLSVDARFNGDGADTVAVNGGERVRVEIDWANNLPSRVSDVSIVARFEGEGFSRSSIDVSGGYYRSSDNTIIWNGESVRDFVSLDSGKSGTVSFSFIPETMQGNDPIGSPDIRMAINIFGRRVNDSGAMEDTSSVLTRKVLVNSDIRLTTRAVYYVGPFSNTGLLPPKAETQTTYTIIWTITNTSSDVSGTVVRGVLPPYVSWTGRIDPASTRISYDEKTGEVVWRAGDVDAGAGFSRAAPEVAFQVALTPSVSHVGKSPDILTGITISGSDRFTGKTISRARPLLTTNLSTDPSFHSGDAQVVK